MEALLMQQRVLSHHLAGPRLQAPAPLTALCPRPALQRRARAQAWAPSYQKGRKSLHICAARGASGEPWWTKNNPENMKDVHSVQELVDEMADAGDKLVIVDFYAQWCHACRSLFPKLCKLCNENPDIRVLKVDWDANKSIAKALNIKVLPYFHFYRGSDGLLAAFSASVSKVQRLRDAVSEHNTPRCYMEKPSNTSGMAAFPGVKPHVQSYDDHPDDVTHLSRDELHQEDQSEQEQQREPAAV